MDYPFEVKDERQLVGASESVFVGRVLEQVGTSKMPGTGGIGVPTTQFCVRVKEVIKGDLRGVVTVSQPGGYVEYAADRDYPDRGVEKGQRIRELILFAQTPLLQDGQEYVFVTGPDSRQGYHAIGVLPYGAVPLEGKDEKQRGDVVERFKKAKKEQIDPRKQRVSGPIPPEHSDPEDMEDTAQGHDPKHQ